MLIQCKLRKAKLYFSLSTYCLSIISVITLQLRTSLIVTNIWYAKRNGSFLKRHFFDNKAGRLSGDLEL